MRVCKTKKSLRSLALVLIIFVLTGVNAWGVCHTVRAGATGNGSGSDWANAMTQLPAFLVRGDTYYLAGGTYPTPTLQDANPANGTITIRFAASADHCTSVGWDTRYSRSQAVFTTALNSNPFAIYADNYVIDGTSRGDDWISAYNIKIDNSSGAMTRSALECGNGRTVPKLTCNDVTVRYVEVVGSGHQPPCDRGIKQYNGSTDVLYEYNYVHDTGESSINWDGGGTITLQYNYVARNNSLSAGCHGQGIMDVDGDTVIFRYNILADMKGTAYYATPAGQPQTAAVNRYVYGNVFFRPASSVNSVGDGVVSLLTNTRITGTFYFLNNTIAGVGSSGRIRTSGTPVIQNLVVQNNLWYNSTSLDNSSVSKLGVVKLIWDHNAYFGTAANINDVDPNKQTAAGVNPFLNYNAHDFRLSLKTAPGSTLPAPFSRDAQNNSRGQDRTWDRGAFEFSPFRPSPATALRAVVR
jgi:hypothetical protein